MHILTFDIEDWFHTFDKAYYGKTDKWELYPTHLVKNIERVCNFLTEHQLKATFFWLGWAAERYPHLIRNISDLGHDIGLHSYNHVKLNDLNRKAFREETCKAINLIEDITGTKINAYRAPGMSINVNTLWAFEILAELGINEDSSFVSGQKTGKALIPDKPFIINFKGFKIKEFPITSFRVFGKPFNYSGSGYFRITPYWFLKMKITNRPYVMSYFHPRDFDVDIHKVIKGNSCLKFKYRLGARSAFHKLEKISENVNWVSMKEASSRLNWNEAEKLENL